MGKKPPSYKAGQTTLFTLLYDTESSPSLISTVPIRYFHEGAPLLYILLIKTVFSVLLYYKSIINSYSTVPYTNVWQNVLK